MPEVTDRVATGAVNGVHRRTSQPRQILWANLLTRSKAIIAVPCARVLIFGQLIDAVSGLLIEVKSVVGVVQDREKSATRPFTLTGPLVRAAALLTGPFLAATAVLTRVLGN